MQIFIPNKYYRLIFLFAALSLNTDSGLIAQVDQDTSAYYKLTTKDGNIFYGKPVEMNFVQVDFMTEYLGLMSFDTKEIKRLKRVRTRDYSRRAEWYTNPRNSRYLFNATAFPLEKGKLYYQNTWIFLNQFKYGITERWSIGMGGVPAIIFGEEENPVWFNSKYSFAKEDKDLIFGAGALYGFIIGESNSNVAMTYGVMTYGDEENNISIGLGPGVVDDELVKAPMMTFSGMIQTGPKGFLMMETYFFFDEDNDGVMSISGRTFSRKACFDYGAFFTLIGNGFVFAPWLSLSFKFG